MRLIAMGLAVLILVLPACATQQRDNGKYWVQKSTDEVAWGTNKGMVWLDECDGAIDPSKWGIQYSNCVAITQPKEVSSPGFLTALTNLVAMVSSFATLGALVPGGSVTQTNTNATSQSVVAPGGHGHGGHK